MRDILFFMIAEAIDDTNFGNVGDYNESVIFLLLLAVVFTQRADPEIAKLHRIAVELQTNGTSFRMIFWIASECLVGRWAKIWAMILHHYTVVNDRYVCGLLDRFAFVYRRSKDHIVALPLALGCCGIHQRRALTVERASLTIGVGFVVVTL